jgi:hypothetical protein
MPQLLSPQLTRAGPLPLLGLAASRMFAQVLEFLSHAVELLAGFPQLAIHAAQLLARFAQRLAHFASGGIARARAILPALLLLELLFHLGREALEIPRGFLQTRGAKMADRFLQMTEALRPLGR